MRWLMISHNQTNFSDSLVLSALNMAALIKPLGEYWDQQSRSRPMIVVVYRTIGKAKVRLRLRMR
jgi:hypothetical protein